MNYQHEEAQAVLNAMLSMHQRMSHLEAEVTELREKITPPNPPPANAHVCRCATS